MKFHAEKKVLAELLSCGQAQISVAIVFNACMDCHEFFKESSLLLGVRIQLRQPKMVHTFTDGFCSCSDKWRWEARLTPTVVAAEADHEPDPSEAKKQGKTAKLATAVVAEEGQKLDVAEAETRRNTAMRAVAVASAVVAKEEQELEAAEAKKKRKSFDLGLDQCLREGQAARSSAGTL